MSTTDMTKQAGWGGVGWDGVGEGILSPSHSQPRR